MKESLASTALASLEWTEERERAIDRVAASGKCDELGVMLFKCRYMLESWAYRKAQEGLRIAYREKFPHTAREIVNKVVDQALSEFLASFCKSCGGARELMVNNLKITCQDCGGSGIKKYSDFERARVMKLSFQRVKAGDVQRGFGFLADLMGSLEADVVRQLRIELEK